ncbi:MAG: response regulator [Bacteroidota bacterium]
MSYRILIADDQLIIRKLLHDLVTEQGGIIVGEATDGKEAIELFATHKPELVLLDLTMPVVGGLDVLQIIKRLEPATKVIVVSAIGRGEEVDKAIRLGVDDYLVKPFSKETVIASMDRVMRQRRVLVADDQLFARRILDQCIEQFGWEKVAEASNGKEAIELFSRHEPDILCLDVDMPVTNGIDALKVIHQIKPQAQILMMGTPQEKEQVEGLGAKGFLEKPLVPEKVEAAVRKALEAGIKARIHS